MRVDTMPGTRYDDGRIRFKQLCTVVFSYPLFMAVLCKVSRPPFLIACNKKERALPDHPFLLKDCCQ